MGLYIKFLQIKIPKLFHIFAQIGRLRFMKRLRSLNLEGNPIAQRPIKDTTFRIFIAAHLPILKYYHYVYIQEEEREEGMEIFRVELRYLEEDQVAEVKERERIAKELADELRLSSSFVELLNENQLFESFWENDTDGAIMMSTGEEAQNLKQEYVFFLGGAIVPQNTRTQKTRVT